MKWYSSTGNESNIVLSTRVRLARNLTQFPFPAKLNAEQCMTIGETVRDVLSEDGSVPLNFVDMSTLTPSETVSLAEKYIISPEFASDTRGKSLLVSEDEQTSIMICEQDHVRIRIIKAGLDLEGAFAEAEKIDSILDKKLDFAFDERLGYLTQCPTNLGTGMRASVMLHLPALAHKGAINRLATTVAKLGLTLRGFYGSSGEISGHIYQLSNQVTMGISEQAALSNLSSIALQIVSQEKQARAQLVKQEDFIDKIYRSWGILKSAYKLTTDELINLVSYVQLGASEAVIDAPTDKLLSLIIENQPATMNVAHGKNLPSQQRDVIRAENVRKILS